jgi:ketosteroid isomerase-like protein
VNEAFNSADIERILELLHPDFETTVPPEFSAEPDTYRGHEGMRRYFESFQEAMNEIRFEQEDMQEVGPYVVLAVRLTATGRTTGIPVEQRLAQVWTVRDGQAVRVRSYPSFATALEAAEEKGEGSRP